MSLQNMQADFVEALHHSDPEQIARAEMLIDLITPISHLMIYRNNIYTHLTNALQEIYPLVTKLVGENFFKSMASDYIDNYPPVSGNIYDYGEYFSDFITTYALVEHLPYLAEIASFEWMCHLIYSAADATAFNIDKLHFFAKEEYQSLHFSLNPAAKVAQFQFPILELIDLCTGEIEDVELKENQLFNLLLFRPEFEVKLLPLDEGDYQFLLAIQNNQSLEAALQAALNRNPQFKLEEKLPEWIKDKIIVDVI